MVAPAAALYVPGLKVRNAMPLMTPDPTFYPSPSMAAQSPRETLAFLRTAWFNLDWVWAGALVVTGAAVLLR